MTGPERNLEAALGYLQLGLFEDANEEIEQLKPADRNSPTALRLRAAIYSEAKSWGLLREVAGLLSKLIPEDSQHWIWWAYATRRCMSIPEAKVILLNATQFHPKEAMIHFNLACYAAQLGELEDARQRLDLAIRILPDIRTLALDDSDLQPLWEQLKDGRGHQET